jgi:hypothetical protein
MIDPTGPELRFVGTNAEKGGEYGKSGFPFGDGDVSNIGLLESDATVKGLSIHTGSPARGSRASSGNRGAIGAFITDAGGSAGCVGATGDSDKRLPQRVRAKFLPSD